MVMMNTVRTEKQARNKQSTFTVAYQSLSKADLCGVMAEQDFKTAFLLLQNKEGNLSLKEASDAMDLLGQKVTKEDIQGADIDGNGSLDLAEFTKLMKKIRAAIMEAFKSIDKNKDGKISLEELMEVVEKQARENDMKFAEMEVKYVFTLADLNDDGMVDFKEFLMMITKHNKSR